MTEKTYETAPDQLERLRRMLNGKRSGLLVQTISLSEAVTHPSGTYFNGQVGDTNGRLSAVNRYTGVEPVR